MSLISHLPSLPAELGAADAVALALLIGLWQGLGWLIENPPAARPSVSVLMRAHRREWMRVFITREPRIFDANILTTLRESTSFFGSACMIAIGGCLALIGNVERLRGLALQFDLAHSSVAAWDIKIIVTMLLVVSAFLAFVWSNRLFGYCAVMMASVPNDPADPRSLPRAHQAAELNIGAAKHFNAGLRSVYFALGSLGWLLGPWVLMVSTLAVGWMVWRREFGSHSRQAILCGDMGEGQPQPLD